MIETGHVTHAPTSSAGRTNGSADVVRSARSDHARPAVTNTSSPRYTFA